MKINFSLGWRLAAVMVVALFNFNFRAAAVLANAWHIPDNAGDLGVSMRNQEFEFGPGSSVTIYSGLQKFNNAYGTANQTGGTFFFKGATQGVWSSAALNFHTNGVPNADVLKVAFQYWLFVLGPPFR